MKPKHSSILALALLAAALMAAVICPLAVFHKPGSGITLPPPLPVMDLQVPPPEVLARIDRLDRSLVSLARRPYGRSKAVDLSLFGYLPMSASAHGQSGGKQPLPVPHKVTMAFYSPGSRFCVIDGRLYSEGARLPEGGRIARIESRRVLLVNGKYRQWIDVTSPLQEVEKDDS